MSTRVLLLTLFLFSCSAHEEGKPSISPSDSDTTVQTDADGDGFSTETDCDDEDSAIHPDATEICDGIDNDCDNLTDDEDDSIDSNSQTLWYVDEDGDGFGSLEESQTACAQPNGFVSDGTDCDDTRGDLGSLANDGDCDGSQTVDDCDDADASVNPDAEEIIGDGIDNDCDGIDLTDTDGDGDSSLDDCDDEDASLNLDDADGDGYTSCGGDCNDFDSSINEDAIDFPLDGIDQNCDGADAVPIDTDADGWDLSVDCDDEDASLNLDDADGDGYTSCDGDCDDANPAIWPYVIDIPFDGLDQNCDGVDLDRLIAAGSNFNCGLTGSAQILCWGGYNNSPLSNPPFGAFSSVSSGSEHSCAIDMVGGLQCWGSDQYGECLSPSGSFTQISTKSQHSCAIDIAGNLQCWGLDNYGQVSGAPSGGFGHVSAGMYHSCALDSSGAIACWGIEDESNYDYGQVSDTPSGSFVYISAGTYHSCALDSSGAIVCWGLDNYGQVSGAPSGSLVHVSAGKQHSCAIDTTGGLVCWGRDNYSQVSGAPSGVFAQLSVGNDHSCAIDMAGGLQCWGRDNYSQSTSDFDEDGYDILMDCDDNNDELELSDGDGDGYSTCDEDCDDSDPAVGQIDNDGDGYGCIFDCNDTDPLFNLDDADEDGYASCPGCYTLTLESEDMGWDGATLQVYIDGVLSNTYSCSGCAWGGNPQIVSVCPQYEEEVSFWFASGNFDSQISYSIADSQGLILYNDGGCGGQTGAVFTETSRSDCDDSDPLILPVDLDGDGYSVCAGDCDDDDPNIGPDAYDLVSDGIDQDCDGIDQSSTDGDGDGWDATIDCDDSDPQLNLLDSDGDGLTSCDGDCDDSSDLRHPDLDELCDDGLDNDCNGLLDCEDSACATYSSCFEDCGDESDNDQDGASDCDDDECWGALVCNPGSYTVQLSGGSLDFERWDRSWSGEYWYYSAFTCEIVQGWSWFDSAGCDLSGSMSGTLTRQTASGSFECNFAGNFRFSDDASNCHPVLQSRNGFTIDSGCGVTTSGFLPTTLSEAPYPQISSSYLDFSWPAQENFLAGSHIWYAVSISHSFIDNPYSSSVLECGINGQLLSQQSFSFVQP